jgi:hypothetical protein
MNKELPTVRPACRVTVRISPSSGSMAGIFWAVLIVSLIESGLLVMRIPYFWAYTCSKRRASNVLSELSGTTEREERRMTRRLYDKIDKMMNRLNEAQYKLSFQIFGEFGVWHPHASHGG